MKQDIFNPFFAIFLSHYAIFIAIFWGALWGSFFHLCIVRVPLKKSIIFPASYCLGCKTPIRYYDNIPIISWLILKGRCRICKMKIPASYIFIELLSACIAGVLWWKLVAQSIFAWELLIKFFIHFFFWGTLMVLFYVDARHYILPNRILYKAIPVFFLLGQLIKQSSWKEAGLGLVVGYILLRGVSDIYYWLKKKEGLGRGDANLFALLGGFFGISYLPLILLISSLFGIALGAILHRIHRNKDSSSSKNENSLRDTMVPFGSVLIFSTTLLYFVLEPICKIHSIDFIYPFFEELN